MRFNQQMLQYPSTDQDNRMQSMVTQFLIQKTITTTNYKEKEGNFVCEYNIC